MSDVFERLYHTPTKASIGQQTVKYESPTRNMTEWKRPSARPSSPTTPPVLKKSPVKATISPSKKTAYVANSRPSKAAVKNVQVPPHDKCMEIFDGTDMNGNGLLSLAELDKAIVEIWPKFNNKPAIVRAYKAADRDDNGFVTRNEFVFFLKYISYYNNLWHVFESTDQDGDRRLSREEFVAAAPKMGISNADAFFDEMDANKGGIVLFDEFCAQMAKQGSIPKQPKAASKAKTAPTKPKQKNSAKKKKDVAPPPVPKAAMNIEVPPHNECMVLFDQIDYNGNGILSLAELDKAVTELWSEFDNKPAIMRAYKASDRDDNGAIMRDEFVFFLKYISYYNNLWDLFGAVDTDGDRRLSKEEFVAVAPKLDIKNARAFFEEMDTNHGGVVLFDEFCTQMAKESSITKEAGKLADSIRESTKSDVASPSSRNGAKHSENKEPIPYAVANIEVPPNEECMKLFDTMDYNGNGILSLAELDKAVVETWPDLDNKPAVMRAFMASDRDNNGFVTRNEFVYFLKYIVYYNNFWNVFESTDADGDRRLSKEEFVAASKRLHITNAEEAFEEMDKNKGGYVLFDEFCAHMSTRN